MCYESLRLLYIIFYNNNFIIIEQEFVEAAIKESMSVACEAAASGDTSAAQVQTSNEHSRYSYIKIMLSPNLGENSINIAQFVVRGT